MIIFLFFFFPRDGDVNHVMLGRFAWRRFVVKKNYEWPVFPPDRPSYSYKLLYFLCLCALTNICMELFDGPRHSQPNEWGVPIYYACSVSVWSHIDMSRRWKTETIFLIFSFFAVHCKVVHFLKEKSKKPFKKKGKTNELLPLRLRQPWIFLSIGRHRSYQSETRRRVSTRWE